MRAGFLSRDGLPNKPHAETRKTSLKRARDAYTSRVELSATNSLSQGIILATAIHSTRRPQFDNDEELSFDKGNTIEILEQSQALTDDGWCRARVLGQREIGLVSLEDVKVLPGASIERPKSFPSKSVSTRAIGSNLMSNTHDLMTTMTESESPSIDWPLSTHSNFPDDTRDSVAMATESDSPSLDWPLSMGDVTKSWKGPMCSLRDVIGPMNGNTQNQIISSEAKSRSRSDDLNAFDIDPDDDILHPDDWASSMAQIEEWTLKLSYFWFHHHERFHEAPILHIDEIGIYSNLGLLTACRIGQLENLWDDIKWMVVCACTKMTGLNKLLSTSKYSWTILCPDGFLTSPLTFFRALNGRSSYLFERNGGAEPGSPESSWRHLIAETEPLSVERGVLDLIRSCGVLIGSCQRIDDLQQLGICPKGISIFVQRSPNVIQLIRLSLPELALLVKQLNRTVKRLLYTGTDELNQRAEHLDVITWSKDLDLIFHPSFAQGIEQKGKLSDLCYHWSLISQAIDIAAISYCGSHLKNSPDHFSALKDLATIELPYHQASQITNNESPERFQYFQVSLRCMSSFLQGQKVWVMGRHPTTSIDDAYVSAHIEDLSDIWGPIHKLSPRDHEGQQKGCYYTMDEGFIGRDLLADLSDIELLPDEIPCHFWPSRKDIELTLSLIHDDGKRLLIGVGRPGLRSNSSCQSTPNECLKDVDLRPCGTSVPASYEASTTFSLSLGYMGSSIGVARQSQHRNGVTQKRRIVNRWLMEPERRQPDVLSMWYGLEFSLCTRNARRSTIWMVLTSSTVQHIFNKSLFHWEDEDCERQFNTAIAEPDIRLFSALYRDNPKWRHQLGNAISWMFEILDGTGVRERKLELLTCIDTAAEPETIASFPLSDYTWAGLLEDTTRSATFAVTSRDCLWYPYIHGDGQLCRSSPIAPRYSILETTIIPAIGYETTDMSELISNALDGRKLSLGGSRLKVRRLLPSRKLLVEWSNENFLDTVKGRVYKKFPGLKDEDVQFQERIQNALSSDQPVLEVLVSSKAKVELPSPGKPKAIQEVAETTKENDRRVNGLSGYHLEQMPYPNASDKGKFRDVVHLDRPDQTSRNNHHYSRSSVAEAAIPGQTRGRVL